jgi:predicted Zn-dependent protease
MSLFWPAHYYPSLNEAPVEVQVRLTESGFEFTPPGSLRPERWAYEHLEQTLGRRLGEPVRLDYREGKQVRALVFAGQQVLEEVARRNPRAAQRYKSDPANTRAVAAFVALPVSLILFAILFFIFGVPLVTQFAARYIPVSWEEKLGEVSSGQLTLGRQTCEDSPLERAVEEMVRKLQKGVGKSPYTYRVKVVRDPLVNAFAAPGGYVVVFSGLAEKTSRPEELAAVLAHELQHVEQRHTTQGVVRAIGIGALVTLILGDSSAGSIARELTQLSFSRGDEESADRGGWDTMVRAGVDPRGMVDMFRILQREAPDMPKALNYLSTHPNVADRIESAERRAATYRGNPAAILGESNWAAVKSSCGKE